jgi:hypothetical protein
MWRRRLLGVLLASAGDSYRDEPPGTQSRSAAEGRGKSLMPRRVIRLARDPDMQAA